MNPRHVVLIAILFIGGMGPAYALSLTGTQTGNSGGNERDATLHARGDGLIRHTITGPSGEYTFGEIPPGEYMAASTGRLCPRVRIGPGETVRILWTGQPAVDPEDEVWTTPHLEYGQSFIATGECITGIGMWIPGPEVMLEMAFHEEGPEGPMIFHHVWDSPRSWVFGKEFEYGQIPVDVGKRYYVRFTATEGKPWQIGMPRRGDVYPDGMAYFDGVPRPESDLGVSITMPNDGLVKVAEVGGGPGYVEPGEPLSENVESRMVLTAGQTFTATTRNLVKLGVNAGFGGAPIPEDFRYAVHEDGPGGRQVGPEVRVRILSNWGGDAIFFPDDLLLEPGRTYYFRYWREDGETFYPYMAQNKYDGGQAFREDEPVPDGWDLTFSIWGEKEPDGITYPYNIEARDTGATTAVIAWETGNPSTSQVEYGIHGGGRWFTALDETKKLHHHVELAGLQPSTVYWYRVHTGTQKVGSVTMRGPQLDFMTEVEGEDAPRFTEPAAPPSASADPDNLLADFSFEEGGAWTSVTEHGARTRGQDGFRPHSGEWMWGWSHVYDGEVYPEFPFRIGRDGLVTQRVAVEKGATYEFSGWLCLGDRNSGWGRDSRARLVYDIAGGNTLDATATLNPSWATQDFATWSQWQRVATTFTAEADEVAVGVYFWQWWLLEGNYLYVDDLALRRVE